MAPGLRAIKVDGSVNVMLSFNWLVEYVLWKKASLEVIVYGK